MYYIAIIYSILIYNNNNNNNYNYNKRKVAAISFWYKNQHEWYSATFAGIKT